MRQGTLAAAVFGTILSLLWAAPAAGFFEAFSKLAEDIRAIEQSTPETQDETIRELQTATFSDVPEGQWFHRYVSAIVRWGIASGYKDAAGEATGTFGPQDEVTVAEMATMSIRAAQIDETTCTGEPGVLGAEEHWSRPFIVCANERGMRIITTDLDLNRPATRAEVLSIIFDAFGDRVPPLLSTFKDTADHPLEADIAYGAALRIVSGDKDASGAPTGYFRPNDPVKRGEGAKVLYERLRVEVLGEQS